MYLRFSVLQHDPESHLPRGLFIASYDMMERAELESYEHAQLRSLLEWFGEHLLVPRCLKDDRYRRAICWFSSGAAKHLDKMWQLAGFFRSQGHLVKLHKSEAPGTIVYADEFQVAAIPKRRSKLPPRRKLRR